MAERLRTGLQIRVDRFDSGTRLQGFQIQMCNKLSGLHRYWKIQTWNRTDGSIPVTCSKATSKKTAISVANEFYIQQMNDFKFDASSGMSNKTARQ